MALDFNLVFRMKLIEAMFMKEGSADVKGHCEAVNDDRKSFEFSR